jgi:tetratricopeptide (TPR) repeat protein
MYNKNAVKNYQKGVVLHQKGQLSGAERAYKKAIKINKDYFEAQSNLGSVYVDQGRLKQASDIYRKALKLLPDHPMLLNNLGNTLQLQGENEKAIGWFNKAIIQEPNYAQAYCNLGNAQQGLGRFEEAIASYERAIAIDPDLADTYSNLGSVLMDLDAIDDAATNFNKAIEIDSRHKDAYTGLGNVLCAQGEPDKAIASYHKAIEIDSRYVNAYNGLGNALSDRGDIDQAIASYHKVIEINPEHTAAYKAISMLKQFSEGDDDIRSMESLYASEGISDKQKMQLAFGLGKAFEDLGKYEKGMEFIMQATRLQRASLDYSTSESQESFAKIKQVFSLDFFARHKSMGSPDQTPVFILGMPRSGTSLVEQILASHPDVFGAGELNDILYLTRKICPADSSSKYPACVLDLDAGAFEELGKQYIAGIRNHSAGTKHIIDKMPHNFLHIGFIRAILPNARIIHLIRDPMDNCLSVFKKGFISGHDYSYDMTELGQYYNLYLDLMEYWRNTLPGFLYDLSYEELVTDQEGQTRKLLDYCNLSWDDACLDFHKTRRIVKTVSKTQVRRPIYKDSVKLWKKYEKQLEPLAAAIYG